MFPAKQSEEVLGRGTRGEKKQNKEIGEGMK